jgi:hypothetical protein
VNRDRLTIRRLLILTAGVAISLGTLLPGFDRKELAKVDGWISLSTFFVVGLALPAPLFTLPRRSGRQPLGPGGLFALTSGLGSLLLLLPMGINGLQGSKPGMEAICLIYCMPLMSVWYLLALGLSRQIGRRLFWPETPWTERYGFFLALLWTPWGIWHLFQMYWEAF